MTYAETYANERYSFFVRVAVVRNDTLISEVERCYYDTLEEAAEDLDSFLDHPGDYNQWELVKLDWYSHYEDRIDCGEV